MKTVAVHLPEEVLSDVEKLASSRGMSVDEYLRLSLEEKLARDEKYEAAAAYVLQKNAELYRRLA